MFTSFFSFGGCYLIKALLCRKFVRIFLIRKYIFLCSNICFNEGLYYIYNLGFRRNTVWKNATVGRTRPLGEKTVSPKRFAHCFIWECVTLYASPIYHMMFMHLLPCTPTYVHVSVNTKDLGAIEITCMYISEPKGEI